MQQRPSKQIFVGGLPLGGGAPVRVQSMLCRPAHDIPGNLAQALELEAAGCELIRAAVPDQASAALIYALKEQCHVPIVADIHFDYRLALESLAAGADKIRMNPGNLPRDKVKPVANACRRQGVPIRIGVNAGSLEADILAEYGSPCPAALVASALRHVQLLESCEFNDIVLSLKSSNVPRTVQAYERLAQQCDYPLHVGITEAGTAHMGLVKSAAGIGALLLQGIGDTIRVSLTAEPVQEVRAAYDILQAVGLGRGRPNLISCPTCGRTKINLLALAQAVEARLAGCRKEITVAVMGCAVNGPGEAREADIGLAGGDGCALLFCRGEILRKVPEAQALDALMEEIEKL
jgi:(E)-4-hydroxy-3-methylbut-2-enyl-diphosphate synthase